MSLESKKIKFSKVSILGKEPAIVGRQITWQIKITLSEEVHAGGKIRIMAYGRECMYPPQTDHPDKAEYLSAKISGVAAVSLNCVDTIMFKGVELKIEDGCLKEGDAVTVIFGDRTSRCPGHTMKPFTHNVLFNVWIDQYGNDEYERLEDISRLDVISDKAVQLSLVADSTPKARLPFSFVLRAFDRFGNPASGYTGRVSFVSSDKNVRLPEDYAFIPNDKGKHRFDAVFNSPGLHTITAKDTGNNLVAASNPVQCREDDKEHNVYWGEIHGHTFLSDGLESPDYYYQYGRDVENLDFCAIADHASYLVSSNRNAVCGGLGKFKLPIDSFWQNNETAWSIISYTTFRYNECGKFVTLLGNEWTLPGIGSTPDKNFGHKNVYYSSDGRPLYHHYRKEADTPEKLWKTLSEKENAITIPHHPGYPIGWAVPGTDWNHHDEEMEMLVEIYSKHGCSEYYGCPYPLYKTEKGNYVQDALARGYKLGFTAGSDTHISRPGSEMNETIDTRLSEHNSYLKTNEDPPPVLKYKRSGLTAVITEELSREGIFNALRKRRCYATTGARILIDIELNGHLMGEEFSVDNPALPIKISVSVSGTEKLEKVEIIRNNQNIHTEEPGEKSVTLEYVDKKRLNKNTYYYMRVTQADGHMAWSSPIWISTGK